MTSEPQNLVQTPDKARAELLHLKKSSSMQWREIALLPQYSGIPAGTLCSFAKGRDVKNPAHRARLGLPALVETPACTHCGAVHTLGDICPDVTPVKVIVYQESDDASETITVVIKRRKSKPRPRARFDLPPDTTPEQRAAINRLTPEQRLAALLEATEKETK